MVCQFLTAFGIAPFLFLLNRIRFHGGVCRQSSVLGLRGWYSERRQVFGRMIFGMRYSRIKGVPKEQDRQHRNGGPRQNLCGARLHFITNTTFGSICFLTMNGQRDCIHRLCKKGFKLVHAVVASCFFVHADLRFGKKEQVPASSVKGLLAGSWGEGKGTWLTYFK